MLEASSGGPWPISLRIKNTQNFDKVLTPQTWRPKSTKFLTGTFYPNLRGPAKEALGLLVGTLSMFKTLIKFLRLKILIKSSHN